MLNWLKSLFGCRDEEFEPLLEAEPEDYYAPQVECDKAALATLPEYSTDQITLPSGFKLNRPPTGYVWRLEGDAFYLRKEKQEIPNV